MVIRVLDLVISICALLISLPILIFIFFVCLFDTGSPLFAQQRVGKHGQLFRLFKFRTMLRDTKSVPTHLVSTDSITRFGKILRATKLDELPQLINVLIGDMSMVGPRPCLPSQHDVIHERRKLGVLESKPGITGLAQISCVDMSEPVSLARLDLATVNDLSIGKYIKVIIMTCLGRGSGDRAKY